MAKAIARVVPAKAIRELLDLEDLGETQKGRHYLLSAILLGHHRNPMSNSMLLCVEFIILMTGIRKLWVEIDVQDVLVLLFNIKLMAIGSCSHFLLKLIHSCAILEIRFSYILREDNQAADFLANPCVLHR
ncbi:hypothetical protein Pfo_000606 [Paulownia fortunei]|nr:hypothetical protein Pfo_000606 [Paulownia fortunei]